MPRREGQDSLGAAAIAKQRPELWRTRNTATRVPHAFGSDGPTWARAVTGVGGIGVDFAGRPGCAQWAGPAGERTRRGDLPQTVAGSGNWCRSRREAPGERVRATLRPA